MSFFESVKSEESVIGSLMLDNSKWDSISSLLSIEDFTQQNNRAIFLTISELAKESKPFDIITMSEKLRECRELDNIGGVPYLADLVEYTPTSENILAYADTLAKNTLRRKVIKISEVLSANAHDVSVKNDDILAGFDKAVMDINSITSDKTAVTSIKFELNQMMERLEHRYEKGEQITGVSTGIIDLDKITHGLQKQDLIILAARPSMGKTAAMMRIIEAAALQDELPNVLVFSIEMPSASLTERMTASIGRIPLDNMRTGRLDDDWSRLIAATSKLATANIHYCDSSTLSLAEMRTIIRNVERDHGKLSLITVDYLQLINEGGESQTHSIAKISTGLKKIAKDFDVPMLALSQLNRDLEKRGDKRPIMADLRQSGQIEQDADLIIFLYRDEVYNPQGDQAGIMEIIVGKHRNGELGIVRAAYLGEYTRVENLQIGYNQGDY